MNTIIKIAIAAIATVGTVGAVAFSHERSLRIASDSALKVATADLNYVLDEKASYKYICDREREDYDGEIRRLIKRLRTVDEKLEEAKAKAFVDSLRVDTLLNFGR